MTDNYLHAEFDNVLDAGPHAFEDCFRLVISGKDTSKHLNITTAETEIVRDVLHAARNLPDDDVRFLFKLIRASIEGFNRANAEEQDPSVKAAATLSPQALVDAANEALALNNEADALPGVYVKDGYPDNRGDT